MNLTRGLKCHDGFSIIEVLVVVAIMSVIGLASADMIITQNREVAALTEKLAAKEMETRIDNAFIKSEFCGCLYRGMTVDTTPGSESFSAGVPAVPDSFVAIPPAPAACTPGSGNIVPPPGVPLPNSKIKVLSLNVTDIVLQSGADYTANLTIAFDPATLIRAMRPIKVPMAFTVDTTSGTTTARPFVRCTSAGAGLSSSVLVYGPMTNGFSTMSCPPGAKLTQCHAEVASADGQSKMFAQAITYLTSASGDLIGCSANMTDVSDSYRLALICVK